MCTTTLIYSITLIIVCAAADRIIGKGNFGRTIPFLVVSLFLVGVSYLNGFSTLHSILVAFAYIVWRNAPWRVTGGSINPKTIQEVLGTALRHSFAYSFVLVSYIHGDKLVTPLIAISLFVVGATMLAMVNTYFYNRMRDYNHYIEVARGVMLGSALSFILL